ncbi:MAG TPA: transketolase C-terminal domain-containing protein [Jatrophihabitans sp.]|jgi:transketolase
MYEPPYRTVLKPYGRALLALAREHENIICLSGDLTKQCEVDLFRDALPARFVHAGMAEANMIGIAAALAREGFLPFVHTFGVFATRRPLDQIINAVAYAALPVRIVGFMPGLSSPGGPSHQAIDDVALMRSIPNMTVIDVADATQAGQVAEATLDVPGPVYIRLKRGEIPVIMPPEHRLDVNHADVLTEGSDVAIFASGMMLPVALAAEQVLHAHGVESSVVNVAVIKPLDVATVLATAASARAVLTVENHSIIGGLGSAVAEVLAESGLGRPLQRVGIRDTFGEAALVANHLFRKYGLGVADVVQAAWRCLGRDEPVPLVPVIEVTEGEYAPV